MGPAVRAGGRRRCVGCGGGTVAWAGGWWGPRGGTGIAVALGACGCSVLDAVAGGAATGCVLQHVWFVRQQTILPDIVQGHKSHMLSASEEVVDGHTLVALGERCVQLQMMLQDVSPEPFAGEYVQACIESSDPRAGGNARIFAPAADLARIFT